MSEYHVPVLLQSSLEALNIQPDGKYVDTTYGAGGHSKAILKELNAKGHLYGFDQDDDAEANAVEDERFTFVKSNFRHLKRWLRVYGAETVDGVLLDLGVSSHQFDMAERGFSYRFDAQLDMRMNQLAPLDAKRVLNEYDADSLQDIFSKYGEVRNARTLARKIVEQRTQVSFSTTYQLNAFLEKVRMGDMQKYLSQVYQAVRMEVNDEMGALEEALLGVVDVLKDGGRAVVISYHSIEDRMVKNIFKTGNAAGDLVKDDFGRIQKPLKQINKKVILPTEEEMKRNNRARSAKMRIAEKV